VKTLSLPLSLTAAFVVCACLVCACQRSPEVGQQKAVPATADAAQGSMLAPGAPVPPVAGTTQTGERVALNELSGKPLVVYFYPKDDTPGCTIEAQEIRDLWKEIQSTNAVVVGVSTDDAESHKAFADKHGLPFFLLPDPDHVIARAFGVPLRNGRASRVSFVFGRDGKLVKVFPEVTPRGHGEELLSTLKSLG
jgi:thioredoxin-dependent peroxiredoxin